MSQTNAQNACNNTPGLAIHGSSSALAKIANTTYFRVNGRAMGIAGQDAPSLALATLVAPILNGGAGGSPAIVSNKLTFGGVSLPVVSSLAFDDGTVPVTTPSCQIFTLCGDVSQTEAGTVSLYWLAGAPFPKHRQAQDSDVAHSPLSTTIEFGTLYIKNETTAVFVPGTTALDTASLTVVYTNNFGLGGNS